MLPEKSTRKIDSVTVLFSAVLLLSPLLYAGSLFQPSDLPRYFATGLLAPITFGLLALRRQAVTWSLWTILGVVVLAWAALTTRWSPDPGGAYVIWMQWFAAGLCAYVAAQQARAPNFVEWMVIASLTGASVVALIGVLENFGVPFFYRDAMVAGSTFYVKNHAALYIDTIAPVAVAAIFVAPQGRLRWLAAAAAGLTVGYLLMSRTRGSWLALLVTSFAALWLCWRFRWPWRQAVHRVRRPLLVAIAVATLIAAYPGEIGKVWVGKMGYDSSANIRVTMYVNTIPIITDHPLLGVGLNGWAQTFRDHYRAPIRFNMNPDPQEQRTHNDPLQFIAELGIPAGLLILALLVLPAARAKSLARNLGARNIAAKLCLAMGLGMVTMLVHSLVDFPFHKPSSLLQFSVWGGVVLGFTATEKTLSWNPAWRWLGIWCAVMLVVFTAREYARFVEGSRLTQYAAGGLVDSPFSTPCARALSAADQGEARFPEYFITHMMRVKVYAKCSGGDDLIRVMTEEIANNPTNAEALIARGRAYLAKQEFAKAEQDFHAVLRRFDHDYRAYAGMAAVYHARGDEAAGREAEIRALELKPVEALRPGSAPALNIQIP